MHMFKYRKYTTHSSSSSCYQSFSVYVCVRKNCQSINKSNTNLPTTLSKPAFNIINAQTHANGNIFYRQAVFHFARITLCLVYTNQYAYMQDTNSPYDILQRHYTRMQAYTIRECNSDENIYQN